MLDQDVAPRGLPARAAGYVRMSTEHQQYSIDNQSDVIAKYAQFHRMEVVRTYTDAGKSGLTFQKRSGLQQLLADVESQLLEFYRPSLLTKHTAQANQCHRT